MGVVTDASATAPDVGRLLRDWRRRRRLSQLDLSLQAEVSARHVSFVETGRARPSREMVLHLADQLDVPLRERNALLLAAGFAPAYTEHRLDDAAMVAVRDAVDVVLAAYEPHPALVVDRRWHLVAGNHGVDLLVAGARADLLEAPVNVLRLSLHPQGVAPRIANLAQWRTHVLHRLAHDARSSGDPFLEDLHRELAVLPGDLDTSIPTGVAVPLRLRHDSGELSFISTVTTFGGATDLTAAELSIEAFLPLDAHTAAVLRRQPLG